jgi:two-component system response regulator NreC
MGCWMRKIRIVIVDDHTLFREALRSLLAAQSAFDVVGEAGTAAVALQVVQDLRPDIVLMDVAMPGVSSFGATRELRKQSPRTAVVFLSMHDDDVYVGAAKAAGARAYVLKDVPPASLFDVLRKVSTRPKGFVVVGVTEPSAGAENASLKVLSQREQEVLKLLAEGWSVKEVACAFRLSVNTAQVHKFRLMRKLNLHNRAQLVHYAIGAKIITSPVGPTDPVTAPASSRRVEERRRPAN